MPHIHELYDFTVSAYIIFNNKVLLVNHPRYDLWLPPGGHIELDEDPEEALYREIEEETGYKAREIQILSPKPDTKAPGVKFVPVPNFINVHEANAPHRHIDLEYFVRVTHPENLKSDEHTEAKWFSTEELDSGKYKTAPDIPFTAKEAIKLAKKLD